MKHSCIDEETLSDYLENRLRPSIRERVEEHLCICADCRDLVMTATELFFDGELIEPESVPSNITQRTIDAVRAISASPNSWKENILTKSFEVLSKGKKLLEDMAPLPNLQPVTLRSGNEKTQDNCVRESLRFSDVEAVIEIKQAATDLFTIEITRTNKNQSSKQLRIGLFAETIEIASVTWVDDEVQFEDIPSGSYSIRFSHNGELITEYSLKL